MSEGEAQSPPEPLEESASEGADRAPSKPAFFSSPRVRRAAALLLPLGLLLAASVLSPHIPRDHTVRIDLREPQQVVGVHVHWMPVQPGANEDSGDASQGSRWNFARGAAPRSLTTTVRLPKGAYDVAIQIERSDHVETVQRKIILGDGEHISLSTR